MSNIIVHWIEGFECPGKHWLTYTLHRSQEMWLHPSVPMSASSLLPLALSLVVQLPHRVRLFATPWTAARQASLALTSSQSLPKFRSIASVMPSSHLIFWCPLLLLPSIFPSIRDFSSESTVHIRSPKYWSVSTCPSALSLNLWVILMLSCCSEPSN